MTGDLTTLWEQICQELQKLISPDAFNRWFDKVKPVILESDKLTLGVENTIYQYWIEENYLLQLKEAAALVMNKQMKFAFQSLEASQETKTEDQPKDKPAKSPKSFFLGEALNPRYTFETFVSGSNSEFAHAAARAVAEAPARTYNPLFLHGSVGLGKTHLLHAIGNRIKQLKKNAKIVYITSEQFTNEFITAIQHG
jgi:chromosomal replication initiator protein